MNAIATVTSEQFAQGMTIEQFIEGMQKNQEQFTQNYESFALEQEEADRLARLDCDLNVLVLAEDWCGDVVRYLPALARMVEAAPNWKVRVFKRDSNPDLADLWLKDGKYRAIPVVVFFDEEMNELACFIEKPAAVYVADSGARARFAQQHPNLDDAALPSTQMSDTTLNLYSNYIRSFRAEKSSEWQHLFAQEILGKLEDVECRRGLAVAG